MRIYIILTNSASVSISDLEVKCYTVAFCKLRYQFCNRKKFRSQFITSNRIACRVCSGYTAWWRVLEFEMINTKIEKLCWLFVLLQLHESKKRYLNVKAVIISYRGKPIKMQQCIKLLLFLILYKDQHVSGHTPPIIRSLKLHNQPLVLHTWNVVGRVVVGQRPTTAHPTTFHVCKSRGCFCSFRLLVMGGVWPETCWASFKIRNNKILIHCCIFLGFSL